MSQEIPEYRAKKIMVEIDQATWTALRTEAEARSNNLRRSSVTEVVREAIANYLSARDLLADARIPVGLSQ